MVLWMPFTIIAYFTHFLCVSRLLCAFTGKNVAVGPLITRRSGDSTKQSRPRGNAGNKAKNHPFRPTSELPLFLWQQQRCRSRPLRYAARRPAAGNSNSFMACLLNSKISSFIPSATAFLLIVGIWSRISAGIVPTS